MTPKTDTEQRERELKQEIATRRKRRDELQAEAEKLVTTIEDRAQEIALKYMTKEDPARLIAQQEADTAKLRPMRDAIQYLDQEIKKLDQEWITIYLDDYFTVRKDFDAQLVAFIEGPMQKLLDEYVILADAWDNLVKVGLKAGVSRQTTEGRANYHYVQDYLISTLSFYLSDASLPADLKQLRSTYADYFKRKK